MNIPSYVLEATKQRFAERKAIRASNIEDIKSGDIRAANTTEQFESRKERLVEGAMNIPVFTEFEGGGAAAIITDTVTAALPTFDLALERIIGKSDFVGVVYLELGLRAATTVGRILVGTRNGGTHAYGTGFLVSPRLLLTNNHVISSRNEAAVSNVEFNYQHDAKGKISLPVAFELDPDAFFVTDQALDYTLVAVREHSIDGTSHLSSYGWNPLIEKTGKVLVGESVNIIQHPEAQPKKVALRENQITDLLDNFLHYRTDTSPGSSGAPVFNDQWELIGLHHSGVPATDDEGNILTRDKKIWTQGMDAEKIDWIGNEGVRISRIIKHVRSQKLKGGEKALFEAAFTTPQNSPSTETNRTVVSSAPNNGTEHGIDDVIENGTGNGTANAVETPVTAGMELPTTNITIQTGDGATLTLPLRINISIGQPAGPGDSIGFDGEESVSSYRDRNGYIPDFLGAGFRVPLPILTPAIAADAATLIDNSKANELKYTNFSVVMNKVRRMAFLTAVNIDGKQTRKLGREGDKWILDPRIRKEHQIGEDAYSRNKLDRGHLVRRLDPVWGTAKTAEKANADTFHFTNCTPQHEDFNQDIWLSLEDYILRSADSNNLKVSVFTGPVFRADDKAYRRINLPQQFWKVAVMVHNGRISATGYMLSQKAMLNRLEAAFVYGPFKTYQVPIRLIEELTRLDFGTLKQADPLSRASNLRESLLETDISDDQIFEIEIPNDMRL